MKNSLIEKLFPQWRSFQTDLHKVIRWGKYLKQGRKMRRQSTMAHTVSVTFAVSASLILLKKYNPFLDQALLLRAFNIHDFSEGTLKKDVMAHHKTDQHDVDEYNAFVVKFSHYCQPLFPEFKKAFLLQFAEKNSIKFPLEAQEVMTELQKTNSLECMLFPALESWEYIFYAWECEIGKNHNNLLTWVLRRQLPRQQEYAKKIPGWREEIFTHEFENWVLNYLNEHKHVPEQV